MLKEIIYDTERFSIMILCLILAFVINLLVQNLIFKNILQKLSEKSDITRIKFFQHITTTAIWLIGVGLALSFIPAFRTISHTLLAGAGLASVVVSLSSQQALSNIVSGVLLIVYKPFKVGETIKVGDIVGKVDDIDLRQTTLIDGDGNTVIIPNSSMSNQTITKIAKQS